MLSITIPARELYDDELQEFIYTKECRLQLEHSLIAVSKWEAKWCKPFFSKENKSTEETLDYVKCMTLTPNIDGSVFKLLSNKNLKQIINYINAPMTATTFSQNKNQTGRSNNEGVTSELIYYWMVALQIPMECQKWHLNRLFTLIQICNIKNTPPKKMNKKEIVKRNAAINEARKRQFNTTG